MGKKRKKYQHQNHNTIAKGRKMTSLQTSFFQVSVFIGNHQNTGLSRNFFGNLIKLV